MSTRAVVMGVAGSGKSVTGTALAERLGVPFKDADSFHPQANIDKQAAGHPLDDHDREPWLAAIGQYLEDHPDGAVVTCSALKRKYRDQLRNHVTGLPFLHLEGPAEVVTERVAARTDHFMPASLLQSQYDTLEPLEADERGLAVDFTQPVDTIVDQLHTYLTQNED